MHLTRVVIALAAAAPLAAALLFGSACATPVVAGAEVDPDNLNASADAAAAAQVTLCKSTYDDVKKALGGAPYRDGVVHKLKARSWKLKPERRKGEPVIVAFDEHDVAVDICFDLPGAAKCEIENQCTQEVKP